LSCPEHGAELDSLIRAEDHAMHHAEEREKNCVVVVGRYPAGGTLPEKIDG
jgi:hypothetical protein